MLLILMLTVSMALQGVGTAFADDMGIQVQPPYTPGDGSSAKISNPPYTEGNYNTEPKYDVTGGTTDGTTYSLTVGTGTVYFKFSSDRQRVEWWSTDVYVETAVVKGGNGYFTYNYTGMNALNDQNLRAPNNGGGNIPTISHICFVAGQGVPQKGSLEITKQVEWGDHESVEFDDFVVTVTGLGDIQYTTSHAFKADGEAWLLEGLALGQYQVTEADSDNWIETVETSPATVVANAKATVTVTNTYDPPVPGTGALKVTKDIDYLDRITPADGLSFQIKITGPSYTTGSVHTFTYDGESFTWTNLIPGPYTISEEDQPLWIENVPADAIVVVEGQTAEAVVHNVYDPDQPLHGSITVHKTIGTENGANQAGVEFRLFPVIISDMPTGPAPMIDTTNEAGIVVFSGLSLNQEYRLIEIVPSGYNTSIPDGVRITLTEGETTQDITINVVNTEIKEPGDPGEPGGPTTTTTTVIPNDADPPVTTLPVEPTPLAAPVIEQPVTLPEEIVPLGVPVLPKTGELPVELFYGLGGMVAALGAWLKRK